MIKRREFACFLPLLVALTAVGCSDEEAQNKVAMRRDCLAKAGVAYHRFQAANERSPRGIDELGSFLLENLADQDQLAAQTVQRLRNGEIVMYWNADLSAAGEKDELYVLGFEAAVPRAGGYLVTGAGSVVLVSPKSFKDFKEYPPQSADAPK